MQLDEKLRTLQCEYWKKIKFEGAFTLAFISRYESYEFSPLARIGHVSPMSYYQ